MTVCDINPHMLEVGQERAKKLGLDEKRISWVEGNAERLPFEDESMDSYTIAFGLRNCTHIDAVLRDAYRCERISSRLIPITVLAKHGRKSAEFGTLCPRKTAECYWKHGCSAPLHNLSKSAAFSSHPLRGR